MPAKLEDQAGSDAAQVSLAALCRMFLRIACTSFGGFMTMISAVQNVVVERRKLLSNHEVLDGLSLASILPGPIAINVVAYVGYRLRGAAGALVCVSAAVAPAFVLMVLLSMAYFRWGQVPAIGKVFMGIVPAVAAIIMAAAWRMGRASLTGWREGVLAVGAAAALLGFSGLYVTLVIVIAAGNAGWWWFGARAPGNRAVESACQPVAHTRSAPPAPPSHAIANLLLLAMSPAAVTPLAHFAPGVVLKLLCAFTGMSMLMFGGGYVFIPLLEQTVVDGYGWVTRQEFVDAVALGQVMPGPAMVSAAFIGFKLAGMAGAAAATVGMFAPTAALMVLCARVLVRIKDSANVQAALRGIRAAATGMVFTAAISIGKSAAPGWISIALFALTFAILARYRIEAAWIVPVAGAIGFLVY